MNPTFLRLTEGSPIRRIGHERWQRNLAVAMGNALAGYPGNGLRISAAMLLKMPCAPDCEVRMLHMVRAMQGIQVIRLGAANCRALHIEMGLGSVVDQHCLPRT